MNTTRGDRGCWLVFLYFFLSVLFVFGGSIVTGWMGNILWGWFITPVFSIQSPGVLAIIGLTLIYGLITMKATKQDLQDIQNINEEDLTDRLSFSVMMFVSVQLGKLLGLGFGWIVHSLL